MTPVTDCSTANYVKLSHAHKQYQTFVYEWWRNACTEGIPMQNGERVLLPAKKFGNRWHVHRSDLEAFLRKMGIPVDAPALDEHQPCTTAISENVGQ